MNQDLHDLGVEYWEWQLRTSPTRALLLGDHRYDDRFEDLSRAAEDDQITDLRRFAARARAVDTVWLTDDERISLDLLLFDTETAADQLEMRHLEFGANHAVGPQATMPTTVTQIRLAEPEHAEAMVGKLRAFGRSVSQRTERLQEGLRSGRKPHAHTVQATIEQLDRYLRTPVDDDVYTRIQPPQMFDADQTAAWRASLVEVVKEHVRPAWLKYRDILHLEVAPAALSDDEPGATAMPNGGEMYRRAIRRHTSVELTADEIHEIGLEQVRRLAEEYKQLGGEALGQRNLRKILATLRDDRSYRFSDGADVVAASEAALAKAGAAIGDWFGRLPKADCGVGQVESGPLAFYSRPAADGSRGGTFYVNTNDPTSWQTFFIEAMAFHEGIPGHHLQLAIAGELEGMPEFRKHGAVTAYAEGWGLYAERLADEMGIYSSPLDRIGMLVADSMRACRLVVDTGIHAKAWSRKKAIDFMCDNSPMDRSAVEAEVDRYIGRPGQALAYMIGRLEILKYRRAAEQAMGDRFDIKGFHDVVLGSGLVPLPTLERMVAAWAAST